MNSIKPSVLFAIRTCFNSYPKIWALLLCLKFAVAFRAFVNVLVILSLQFLPVANICKKCWLQILVQENRHLAYVFFLYFGRNLFPYAYLFIICTFLLRRGIRCRAIQWLLAYAHNRESCQWLWLNQNFIGWSSGDSRGMHSSCREQTLFQRVRFRHQTWIWFARFSSRTPIEVEQLISCWLDEWLCFPCGLYIPSPYTLVEEAFSPFDCLMLCNLFDLVHLRLGVFIFRILAFDIPRFCKVLCWIIGCRRQKEGFLEGRYLERAGFLRWLLVFHLLHTWRTRTILLRIDVLIWLGIFLWSWAEKLMYVLLNWLVIALPVTLYTWGTGRRLAVD